MSDTPDARRLQLGRELAALRERAGKTRQQAADALDCQPAKISKVEHGKLGLSRLEVRTLLGLYGVPDGDETARLLTIADEARRRSVHRVPDWVREYVSLEAIASDLQMFSHNLVPGLLQTEAYTRALVASATGPREADRVVAIRRDRQARLFDVSPPTLNVILHEAALRVRVGGPDAMGEQLRRLLDFAALPHLSLRVIPFAAGAYPSMESGIVIVGLPDGERVVYLETLWRADYVRKPPLVAAYMHVFDMLTASALDEADSAALVTEVIGDLA